MNFLQLVQRLHSLARVGQGELATSPNSVANQTGLLGELVTFIQMAWEDIQNENPYWRFMIKEGSLILPQGSSTISPTAIEDYDALRFATSDGRGRFITFYRDSRADEQVCRYVSYQDFAYSFLARGERPTGTPGSFTVLPDGRLRFDAIAEEAFTVLLDYKRLPQTLTQNTDTPIMPAKYHNAIIWWAMVNYYCSTRDGTAELRAKSKVQLDREMQKLRNEQLFETLGYEVAP